MKRSRSGARKNKNNNANNEASQIEQCDDFESSCTSKRAHREESADASDASVSRLDSTCITPRLVKRYDEYFEFEFVENWKVGICKMCKKNNVCVEIKMLKSNTSGLKWHLQSKHKAIHDQIFPVTQKPGKSQHSQQTIEETFRRVNQKQVLNEKNFHFLIVEWLAVKYLPLSFFDDEATQSFFRAINPDLHFPKRTTITTLTSTVHAEVREVVTKILQDNGSRISFTVDAWTSIRSQSYYGITAHYIDDNWKLHSLAIDFIPSHGKHTGVDIARFIHDSLEKSGLIDKIQGITVDNASVNKTFMVELEKILCEKHVPFDAEEQHFHCFAHVLNLAAQDVLKSLKVDNFQEPTLDACEAEDESDDSTDSSDDDHGIANLPPIAKLRAICKKMKRSEKLKNKLHDFCNVFEEKQIDVPLDVSTRWNSSFDMITAGLQMRNSISALASNSTNLKHLFITEDEWAVLTIVQKYLKCFKKFSTILCGDQYATLPSVVVGVNILIDSIEKLCHTLDKKSDRSASDESIIVAFQGGRDKLVKHYNKSNWIYCAVLILDPRHKLEIFDKTSWGRDLKKKSFEVFKRILATKYDIPTAEAQRCSSSESENNSDDEYSKSVKALYTSTKKTDQWQVELDNYLRLDRVDLGLNILEWWKANANTFPRLSRMARDLLAICASSAPVERLFSRASLIIRKHRNRLSNKNAEALLCLNSWFQCSLSTTIKAKAKLL